MENLTEFKNWLLLHKPTSNTIDTYFIRIKKYFNDYEKFEQKNVDDFLLKIIKDGKKPSTFNGYISSLKTYAEFSKIEMKFPKQRKLNDDLQPYLKEKELKQILKELPLIVRDCEKWSAIISFMFYTGLRVSIVANLKREDINLEEKSVIVRNSKSKKDRVCVFSKQTANLIKLYFLRQREISNAFNTSKPAIQKMIKKIGKQTNHKFLHAHSFKHSAGHYWLKISNNDLQMTQKLLGHSDSKMTMKYLQTSNADVIEDAKSYLKRKKR